jgi:WD40 repeat protein
MTHVLSLPVGTELVGEYRIERVLGAGGFGITYLATEVALGRAVTIKEYFPADFAARNEQLDAMPRDRDCADDFKWGLDRFTAEAKTLARFDHPSIVRVFRFIPAGNTGYMVLQFEEGQSLRAWMKNLGRAPRQKELDRIVPALLDALAYIHDADYLHRDVAPDNIIIRADGTPVLIDFGSARGEIAERTRTLSALVKPGYSPYEQYAETGQRQGPWTDIYALGATLYHLVTGKRPPDSPSRVVKDSLVPAHEAALSSYRASFLAAIDRALALDPARRPQSIVAWRGDLLAPEPSPGWFRKATGRRAEPAAAAPAAVAEAQGAVPPPPDAPGGQGGLLDFIDGLRRKAEPQPSLAEISKLPEPPAEPLPLPPEPAAKRVPEPKPAPRRPPRPRRIKSEAGNRGRSLLWKLAIGAGVASTAVAFQDKLPRFETRTAIVASKATKETPQTAELRAHKGAATAVAFTDDGRLIASAGADGTLKLWNAANGSAVRTVALGTSPATSLAVSGRRAATGHEDGSVVLVDLDRGEKLSTFRRNEAPVWSVAFAGGPTRVAAASHDWTVALWDQRSATTPALVLEGHDSSAQAVAFSGAGPYLASGGADRTVKLWSPDETSPIRTYRGHRDFVTAVGFAPDGRQLASGSLDGGIRVWSTASSRLLRTLPGHKSRVGGLAYSPSGELLASAGEDGAVKIWDVRRGRALRTFAAGGPPARALAFAPDGRRIAAATIDGAVRLWDATIGRARDE